MPHDFAFPKLKHLRTTSRSLLDTFNQDRASKFQCIWLRTYDCEELFLDRLRSSACDAWSYIVHNKDSNEDGSPCMPHIHALLHFPACDRIRLTSLDKWFTQNTEVEVPIDKQACFDYQIHANNPDKFQYDESERKTFNISLLLSSAYQRQQKSEEDKQQANADFIKDLRELVPYDLAIKYGRDYIKNRHSYHSFIVENPHSFHTDESLEQYKKLLAVAESKCNVLTMAEVFFECWNEVGITNNFTVALALYNSMLSYLENYNKLPEPQSLLNMYMDALKREPIYSLELPDAYKNFEEMINK